MKIIAYPQFRIFYSFLFFTMMMSMGIQAQETLPKGFKPDRHMRVSEVKHRMKGYALTVFEGVKIEALPVRVISVEYGSTPGKAVVWVECTSERMKRIGPVQGMSGSPVFLWDEDTPEEERIIGKGGRMLGALAFGYSMTRDTWCAFGVQPIEFMLRAENRTELPDDNAKGKQANAGNQSSRMPLSVMRHFHGQLDRGSELTSLDQWRLRQMYQMQSTQIKAIEPKLGPQSMLSIPEQVRQQGKRSGQWVLPMNVGTAKHAESLAPLFKGTGLKPVGFNSAGSGRPPLWIDPQKIKTQPGGVLSIPIVTGDADWASIGTITEVLPDGSVLGFGHAMSGQGKLRMPMSTGYVHFIHPSMQNSFKLGGSLRQVGAILNDENVAVIGKPKVSSGWVPIKVKVKWPDPTKSRSFEYQVVDHPDYLARALPFMAVYSITGDTEMPQYFTVRYKYRMTFEGDRVLEYAGQVVQRSPQSIVGLPASMIDSLTNNFEGQIPLLHVEAEIEIIEKYLNTEILEVRLDQREVAPGETVTATVKLQNFRERPHYKKIRLKIPEDAEEGRWRMSVGGATTYYDAFFSANSYLLSYDGMDELLEAYQALLKERSTGLFMVATAPTSRISIGRIAYPEMPGSRLLTMAGNAGSRLGTWRETLHSHQDSDYVYSGRFEFTLEVKKK